MARDALDDPAELEAFVDAVRWGAVTSADQRSLQRRMLAHLVVPEHYPAFCLPGENEPRYPRPRGASRVLPGRPPRADQLRTPGVYLLIGLAEDVKHEHRIYVGEGEDPRARIDSHHANKDFWNRVVLFTSFGQTLNKATIRYLEARLLQLVATAQRAELDNGNAPALPPLSEPEIADAESFLSDVLVIYPILGINSFELLDRTTGPDRLRLLGPQASAEGSETEEGFVVFTGARARSQTVESMPAWAANLRETLIQSGALVPVEGGASLRLTTDHVFNSPSAAAAALLGRSAAGPIEWKDEAGRTLKEIRAQAVSTAV